MLAAAAVSPPLRSFFVVDDSIGPVPVVAFPVLVLVWRVRVAFLFLSVRVPFFCGALVAVSFRRALSFVSWSLPHVVVLIFVGAMFVLGRILG